MHVVSSYVDDDGFAPGGLEQLTASGPHEQTTYRLDIAESAAGQPLVAADHPDEETMASYVERARTMAEAMEDGTPFGSKDLARALACTQQTAESVLAELEEARLLTCFKPLQRARLVQTSSRRLQGGGSQSDEAGSTGSHSDESVSPIARRQPAAGSVTPGTEAAPAEPPKTPGHGKSNKRALKQPSGADQENAGAASRALRRKVSTTALTVRSQAPALSTARADRCSGR